VNGRRKPTCLDDEECRFKILRISGRDPKYGAWSVDGKAWIMVDGEKKYERDIAVNVSKDDGNIEGDRPDILHRMKEKYASMMKEDDEYQRFSAQSLETEKDRVDELEGKEFSL